MAPGMAHNPSQPGAPGGIQHQIVAHMGVSGPGPQMNPAALMGGMPPGVNPNAHAMQHLNPAQAQQMFQQHQMNPMSMYKSFPLQLDLSQTAHADFLVMGVGVGNQNIQQQVQQHQRLQALQQQQQARQALMAQQAAAMQGMGGMPMGVPLNQAQYPQLRGMQVIPPHMRQAQLQQQNPNMNVR